jgi:phytoene synthase
MPDLALRPSDLEHCRALLTAGSKSFSAASRLLPRRVREPATVLYAFCRIADDAVDAAGVDRAAAVADLRERLDRVYRGEPADVPVDRALAEIVHRRGVPRALLDALVEGMAWDADGRRYETLDDLHAYAARVAGTVGAMMTLLMGPRAPHVLARACDLGAAMQLTNIARDVGEDAARGRIYLPLSWLRDEGIDPDELARAPRFDPRLARVVRRLLAAADELYARADGGVSLLPADCRVAIRAARLIYSAIGARVARAGYDSVSRRAVVPTWQKVWLLLRALPARLTAPKPSADPPIAAARFLVHACEPAS